MLRIGLVREDPPQLLVSRRPATVLRRASVGACDAARQLVPGAGLGALELDHMVPAVAEVVGVFEAAVGGQGARQPRQQFSDGAGRVELGIGPCPAPFARTEADGNRVGRGELEARRR